MNSFFYNKLSRKEYPFLVSYCLMVCVSGFFISSFDVIVHAEFFQYFGYKYLALTYILSGFSGMAISFIYSVLYKRISTKKFFFIIINFLILFASVFYVLHFFTGYQITYFVGMVLLFPVNTLFLLTLWRFGRKVLLPKQTRLLFPKLKSWYLAGLSLGAIIFTVGLYFVPFQTLIYLSFYSLLILWPLLLILLFAHSQAGIPVKEQDKYIPVKHSLFLYFTSKYTTLLFTFAFLSAVTGFAIHFAFVNVTWVAFRSIFGMAKFYGLFIAAVAIFNFGIDRFLIKRILYTYDSPYSLVLIPFLLVIAIGLSIGGNYIAGKGQQLMDHFSVFFILIAILQVSYTSVIFAVQTPSFRTLFHSLDLRYRQVAYPRIEGTVVMTGLAFAGAVVLGLTFLKFYNLVVILIFTLTTSILWLWVGIKLIKFYRKALNEEIARLRFRKLTLIHNRRFEEQLSGFFSGNDDDKIIASLEISKIFQPIVYEHDLIRLLAHPSVRIKSYVLENIEHEVVYESLPELYKLEKHVQPEIKEKLHRIIASLEKKQDATIGLDNIPEKLYSPDDNIREKFLQTVINSNIKNKEGVLVSLSKDTNITIQNRAIKSLARVGTSGYNYSLIEFLYPGNYNPYAFEAIAASKDQAIDFLDREALLPGTDKMVLSRIIRLYGKIGTARAIEKLLKTLEYADSYLMNQTIEALYENRFQATKNDKYKILGYFVKLMGILTYNLNAYNILSKNKKADLLSNAFLLEAELNIQNLFKLLSLIYNPNIITSIQELFQSGSRAEISHAIELTDEYVDEDIKPLFLTIVEDISLSDKLKRLEYYFPQQKLTVKDIITSTLTYDFNLLTLYTRTCALILLEYLKIPGYTDELIFCSGHPEPLFAESAKHVLGNYNTSLPKKKSKKLRWPSQSVHDFLSDEGHRKRMFVKYYELKKFHIFNSLSEHIALELTKVAREFKLLKGQKLDVDQLSREYSVLLTHVLVVNEEGKINFEFGKYFISTALLKSKNVKHIVNGGEDGVVWAFREDTVRRLLYDNIEFANVLITSLEHFKLVTK